MNEMTAFASLIAGQIQRTVQAEKQAVLEPGTIGMDLYLSVHSLKDRIPPEEYLRCGHVETSAAANRFWWHGWATSP